MSASAADPVAAVQRALQALPAAAVAEPVGARVAAVLILLGVLGDAGDAEVVYTRRRGDLRSHPGQISFPGGRVEPGETVEQAAVREAAEEVALRPESVELLGRLPALYVPPSRFWVQPVVARWRQPHALVPAEAEVAAVLRVRLSALRDAGSWRAVRLSVSGWTWAWQLDADHLLWGATAMVTDALLSMVDPAWAGGAQPTDYGHREVRPWAVADRAVPRPGPPRLPGLPEVAVAGAVAAPVDGRPPPATADPLAEGHPSAAAVPAPNGSPGPAAAAAAGRAVAEAVRLLGREGPVLVLAGSGGNGAAGRAAADVLAELGHDVVVVESHTHPGRAEAAPWHPKVRLHGGAERLPLAAVIIDALVGGGLRGPLTGHPLALLHALRGQDEPVVSIDLPSGLDPVAGLVGETFTADVTVALGAVRPGVLHLGLAPFVGDLYLARLDTGPPLLRVVAPPPPPDARPGDYADPTGPDGGTGQTRGP
ncbi:hypothetical protein BH24ACT14_BH24ACT14_09530 [soil metagenome]